MKLHLPLVLMTTVVSSVSYAASNTGTNLFLTDSQTYTSDGEASFDLIWSYNSETNYTNQAQLINNGNMTIGNIWNTQMDDDSTDENEPLSKLTIQNNENASLKITGSVVDDSGIADGTSGVFLVQEGGSVEFAGGEDSKTVFYQISGKSGNLLHSGDGDLYVDVVNVSGEYSLENTGSGVSHYDLINLFAWGAGTTTIKQNGTGTTILNLFANPVGDTLNISQSAGTVEFITSRVSETEVYEFSVDQINATGGELVHSSDGDVNVSSIISWKDYSITNSDGNLAIADMASMGSTTINQNGAGKISIGSAATILNGSNTIRQTAGTVDIVGEAGTTASFTHITGQGGELKHSGDGTLEAYVVQGSGDYTVANNGNGDMNIGAVIAFSGNTTIEQNGNGKTTIKHADAVFGQVNIAQSAGKVEFLTKADNGVAKVNRISATGGELVHSGDGELHIQSAMPMMGSYGITQTGNGKMVIGTGGSDPTNVGGLVTFLSTTTIKQTGAGSIVNIGSMGVHSGALNLEQSGGGTFENIGDLSLTDVAISGDSTLMNSGTMSVSGQLAVNGATLALTEGAGAINMSGASITALDGVVFELVLGDSAAALFADPTATTDFSFTVLSGLDSLTAGEDWVTAMKAAFTVEQLQLAGVNANGELVDLRILGAEMTYADGAVTISGTATIPEPTTATLSLLALAALAARRRRKL